MLKKISLLLLLLSANVLLANKPQLHAEDTHKTTEAKEEAYDPIPVIMHHISDAHEWHFWGEGESSVTLPLPVILWTEKGLVTFMSSEFHHDDEGKHLVTVNGQNFVKVHGKIYEANATPDSHGSYVSHDEEGHVTANKPFDISLTKNVAGMLFGMLVLLLLFIRMARKYKTNGGIPRKFAGWMEPIIILVRDDIAKENIGEKRYKKFVPFLLSIFFFIWILNLMGLVPGFANVTGNIAFTMVLSVITLIVVNINGNKNYWKHIFWPPVPLWLKPMMIPVELIGIITKPFALMIRLFANMAAGHIVILSLVSLIFLAGSMTVAPGAIALVLFISVLELLVALLQAYIFTLLTALFIGMAVDESHH